MIPIARSGVGCERPIVISPHLCSRGACVFSSPNQQHQHRLPRGVPTRVVKARVSREIKRRKTPAQVLHCGAPGAGRVRGSGRRSLAQRRLDRAGAERGAAGCEVDQRTQEVPRGARRGCADGPREVRPRDARSPAASNDGPLFGILRVRVLRVCP